jgi:hypothetical protein
MAFGFRRFVRLDFLAEKRLVSSFFHGSKEKAVMIGLLFSLFILFGHLEDYICS